MEHRNRHPLATIRRAAGLSQTILAVRAGVSLPTVQRAERGLNMSEDTWDALAASLGVPVASIRHDKNDGGPVHDVTSTHGTATAA
jgi:transcriptional regulator with XRE-family HTH domain